MKSLRALLASVVFTATVASMFVGGLAFAQVPDVDVDIPVPNVDVNVDPNTPSGSEINCQIYAELVAKGEPIPPGFDATGCEGGGGGGGGSPAACADGVDNDNDGLIDMADSGCSSSSDTDESNSSGGGNGGGDGGGGSNGGGSGGGSGGSGGNSGGPAPACEDNVDNDGDGLKDMSDPGCENAADNDETNAAQSVGGGGGGSSATTTSATSTEATSVESTLDVVASCDMYLTTFIKPGANNDSEQVTRLQSLLNESEGANLTVNGTYDAATIAAVHAFQTKYAGDILTPWGVTKSTGFVYLTTRKKVNEVYCKLTKEFPLSTEEQQVIAKTRTQITSGATVSTPAKPATPATSADETENAEIGKSDSETQTAAAGSEGATRSINRLWDPVRNLFGRIFGR